MRKENTGKIKNKYEVKLSSFTSKTNKPLKIVKEKMVLSQTRDVANQPSFPALPSRPFPALPSLPPSQPPTHHHRLAALPTPQRRQQILILVTLASASSRHGIVDQRRSEYPSCTTVPTLVLPRLKASSQTVRVRASRTSQPLQEPTRAGQPDSNPPRAATFPL